MYYVWDSNADLDSEFAYFSNEPNGFETKLWIAGEKITEPLDIFELICDEDSPNILSDLLLTDFPLQVFSPKLKALFDEIDVKNVQYLPIKIRNHESGDVNKSYTIANIIGKIDCLDFDKSTYKRSRRSGNVLRVSKFCIVEDDIRPLPGSEDKPLIFRLGEFPWLILVHERIKQFCEEENISGVEFTETQNYS